MHTGWRRAIVAMATALVLLTVGLSTGVPDAGADTSSLAVVSASPTGGGAPRTAKIALTFNQAVTAASVTGTVGGATVVATQVTLDPTGAVVAIDPGVLEYGRTYPVSVSAATAAGERLASPYTFSFTVQANPSPNKRPTSTIDVPAGTLEAGRSYTISGRSSGYVWERAPAPLDLPHVKEDGTISGNAYLVHPDAMYFPDGMDGYKYWIFYTPYPPREDENPVLLRSNDGVNFTSAGVKNPLFIRSQPPYDSKNLADVDIVRLGDTWMMWYELETFRETATAIGPWMHGGTYIGLATSKDGKNWAPYGGPYTYDPAKPPTAPPANGNPVINLDSSYPIEAPSNSQTAEPAVIFKDGVFHMWRSVFPGNYVAYTTATDPQGPWTKTATYFSTGGGVYGPHPDIVYDAERGIYRMVHIDPGNKGVAMRTATSPAGPWTPHPMNPVFSPSSPWEGSALYRSTLVQGEGGQWFMYYTADMTGAPKIGVAREVPGVRRTEVSTNGGATWAAVATAPDGTWSLGFTPASAGRYDLRVRVTDDVMQGGPVSATVDVAGPEGTVSTIWGDATPAGANTSWYQSSTAYKQTIEVGTKFRSSTDGRVNAIRFYKDTRNNGPHTGHLWSANGTLLASVDFTAETASGWQQANLSNPVQITANTTYIVSYHSTSGYTTTVGYFTDTGAANGPLRALRSGEDGPNGVYLYTPTPAFPTQTADNSNYWVDVVVETAPPANTAPTARADTYTATQDTTLTIAAPGVLANDTDLEGSALDARTATTPANGTIDLRADGSFTYQPNTGWSGTDTFTYTTGDGTTRSTPATVTITVAAKTTAASIWGTTAPPTNTTFRTDKAREVGVKFRSSSAGKVTAIRFYKDARSTGAHSGHLWSASGTLLATVTFTNETASGWQQANLSTPVAIAANTTYIVSYLTSSGFLQTADYFAASGYDNPPLRALKSGEQGGNGVFVNTTTARFPNKSEKHANYWVDVVVAF